MKILAVLSIIFGIWFLASAATVDGLLPSGHGTGRASEVMYGLGLVALGIYLLFRKAR